MTLEFRDFIEGDQQKILALFEDSFNRVMEPSYWKWRYADNVLNKYMIRLALDGDKLAAHYAVSPTKIYIEGKEYNSAISMTTMTHPDYRGMGLFTKLATQLFKSEKNKLDLVYGVPNDNSIKGFTKYLNFEHIKEIPVNELKLEGLDFNADAQCKKVLEFDSRVDELMDNIKLRYDVILSRSSRYLNWRFVQNPQNKYNITIHETTDGIDGYAVTKTFDNGSVFSGDIVDIVSLNTDTFKSLVNTVCAGFKKMGLPVVKIWNNDKEYIKALREMDFRENEEHFHFIVGCLNRNLNNIVNDFENWYITMSDIDIF